MNLRPSGYEPDELPDCSTPRQCLLSGRPAGHLCLPLRASPCAWRTAPPRAKCALLPSRGRSTGSSDGTDHREQVLSPATGCFGHPLRRPGGDLLSHTLRCSTIGAEGLHGRVRDGIGCGPLAITTKSSKRTATAIAGGAERHHTSKRCVNFAGYLVIGIRAYPYA